MMKSFSWPTCFRVAGFAIVLFALSGCITDKKGPVPQPLGAFESQRRSTSPDAGPAWTGGKETLDAELALGRRMEQNGELEQAAGVYRKVLTAHPEHSLAIHRLAVVADRLGKTEESARLFDQALRMRPQNADMLCDFGYSLYRQQRWSEAEDRFRQALAVNPRHLRTHNNYGLLLARTDRHEEALLAFCEAGCSSTESHMNLALALALDGRPGDAQRQLDGVGDVRLLSADARSRLNQLQQLISNSPAEAAQAPSLVESRTVAHWE